MKLLHLKSILLVLLLLVTGSAYANENVSLKPLPCEIFSLDNGMKVVLSEKHDSPAVAVYAYVKTGAIYEGKYLGCGVNDLTRENHKDVLAKINENNKPGIFKRIMQDDCNIVKSINCRCRLINISFITCEIYSHLFH